MKAAMHDMLELLCIHIECTCSARARRVVAGLRRCAPSLNGPPGLSTTTIKLVVLLAAHGPPQ